MTPDPEKPDGHPCVAIDEIDPVHGERVAALYETEHGALVGSLAAWAQARGAPSDLARDVAAEAFGVIFSMRNPPSSRAGLEACLLKEARRLMGMYLKRGFRRHKLLLKYSDELAQSPRDPELLQSELQQQAILDRIVTTLPDRQRKVFMLSVRLDLPLADVVARLAEMGTRVNERTVRRDLDALTDRLQAEIAALDRSTKEEHK